MNRIITALILCGLALPVAALEKIAGNPVWSGYWNLGVGAGNTESNFLARISGIDIDLSDKFQEGLGSPDDEDYALPVLGVRFAYSLENERTHFILENDQGDWLQFEREIVLAVQHYFEETGHMQLALLQSSAADTEVWSDPYAVLENREDTGYSYTGGRFTWDGILDSNFEIIGTLRVRDIDEERSGVSLGLPAGAQDLLDREGDALEFELGYLFSFGDGRHSLRPSARYIDRDLDGAAMAQDGYGVDLVYSYTTPGVRWTSSVGYADLDGDEVNPLFGEVNDAERFTISTKLMFPGAFGLREWMPVLTARWGEEDSDIDFNDTQSWLIGASLYRTF
jgi:hypothetical protein